MRYFLILMYLKHAEGVGEEEKRNKGNNSKNKQS